MKRLAWLTGSGARTFPPPARLTYRSTVRQGCTQHSSSSLPACSRGLRLAMQRICPTAHLRPGLVDLLVSLPDGPVSGSPVDSRLTGTRKTQPMPLNPTCQLTPEDRLRIYPASLARRGCTKRLDL